MAGFSPIATADLGWVLAYRTHPESQLDTWSRQGAVTTASDTYTSIKRALNQAGSPLAGKDVEIYLQGSYGNDTNIRADSDVDVVVQLNSTFQRDISGLSADEQQRYLGSYSDATYFFADFRADVLKMLRSYYGLSLVTEGNKSLKVAAASGRLAADVVPCLQYRKYTRFRSLSDQSFVEGMRFQTQREGRWVINYPKEHYKNGVAKHSAAQTNGWFKPTVRIFKNARTYMRERGLLGKGVAPSYFVQCLLYNVPNALFGASYQSTVPALLNWLREADMGKFVCQNGQVYLFGDTPEQWSIDHAKTFTSAMITLWNGWS